MMNDKTGYGSPNAPPPNVCHFDRLNITILCELFVTLATPAAEQAADYDAFPPHLAA
jgi:hypothetical protein